MQIRSALVLAASLSLVACAFQSPTPTGSSTTHQTNGKGSSTTSSSSGGSTGDDTDKPVTTENKALDGTWDISAAGPDAIGPSEMTIKGNRVTGVIVMGDEGTGDLCQTVQNRMTFDSTISGDDLTFNFAQDTKFSGDCDDGAPHHTATTLKATRKHDAKNANGATAFEGEWQILSEDGTPAVAVNVAGLVAKAWDNAQKSGSPVLTTNVNGKDAKNAASDASLAFAARKR